MKVSPVTKLIEKVLVAKGKRSLADMDKNCEDALVALAKFYKTSTDYLLGLTDERKPYP